MALRVAQVTRSKADGGEQAFERLFVSEYRRVVAIAYRVLNDVSEAEDVAQEAFSAFHRRHDAAAPFAPAWLHRAAGHLALNVVRSRRRRDRREQQEAISRTRADDLQGFGLDPSWQTEVQEQRQMVREVLGRLPKRSAEVLILRYSGLSYSEVAAAMECRVGAVGTMLRRAEAAFRKEIERETS